MNRAKLSPFWENKKEILVKSFETLKEGCEKNWYPTLWAETRAKTTFLVNPKSDKVSEDETNGVVLRIFDGHTLFEKALSEITEDHLIAGARELIERVKDLSDDKEPLIVKPLSWWERLALPLENDIKMQIPKNPSAEDWVHFGCVIQKELWPSQSAAMSWVKDIFKKLEKSKKNIEPDYLAVNLALNVEDQIFIDSSVRMTQSMRRNRIMLIATKGGDRGYNIVGGLGGMETVSVEDKDIALVYKRLDDLVRAERLEPGAYKLLMSPAVAGVFAHEAFGHTQEGDTWARGRSKARELFENKIRVGNDHATIMNNPAIYQNGADSFGAWGSYFFDEEGWFAHEQTLVEKGYLKSPMTNMSSSFRLNVPRSANGKRQDWSRGMYVRQTNTYFTPGDCKLDDLFKMIDYGFLAEECAGGMEDPKGMGIQVGIAYLEEIKDGKLTGRTFKGPNGGAVQMTGYVPDCLNHIVAKAHIDPTGENLNLKHPWNDVGGCGKYHKEFVNAGCGGPYMLVEKTQLG